MVKKFVLLLAAAVIVLSACSDTSGDRKGADTAGSPKKVVVDVMSTDAFLETAVRKFEEQHPDIDIEINEFLATPKSDGNGMVAARSQADVEKFIQTVTTKAISGKAADLFVMENLPENKFIDKKILVNFNDLMAKDSSFDTNLYYQNVFQAFQVDGGLYSMPLTFALDLIQGNSEMMRQTNVTIDDKTWTWSQFQEITTKLKAEAGPDYVAFVNLFSGQLLYDYIDSNYTRLVDRGKASFDSELFRDMMRQIKAMYDEGILKEEFTYDYSKALFAMTSLSDMEQAVLNGPYYRKPTVDGNGSGGSFKSFLKLGMNSKSDVQKEAWEFVKFLLSEDMQSSPGFKGIPVHKGVVENRLREIGEKAADGTLDIPAKGKLDTASVQQKIGSIRMLLEGAGMKSSSDFKVQSIAIEEFKAYMSGQKSAEDVSKLIQNRVTTYLNE